MAIGGALWPMGVAMVNITVREDASTVARIHYTRKYAFFFPKKTKVERSF